MLILFAAGRGISWIGENEGKALLLSVLLSALLEVYTTDIDNLVLPLYFLPTFAGLLRALEK